MKKAFRRILALVLIAALLLTSNFSAFAAIEEVYLSDLRIIYAEDYSEAKDILSSTDFKDYKLLNENLNEGTKKIGVWLAYKTTTDIEDAITDLSVMQMDGGYQEGNYQEMIKDSLEEYKTYLIDTPGFASFDMEAVDPIMCGDLQYAFPEFEPYLDGCRFNDCAHLKEPDCAVRNAVRDGKIHKKRYQSYKMMYADASKYKHWEMKNK